MQDEEKRKSGRRVEAIDVAENAAAEKVVLDCPNVKFVDYLTLPKDRWRVEDRKQIVLSRTKKYAVIQPYK